MGHFINPFLFRCYLQLLAAFTLPSLACGFCVTNVADAALAEGKVVPGLFPVTRYSTGEMEPGFTARAVCQDDRGIVYAGGLTGVFRFNGSGWKRIHDEPVWRMICGHDNFVYAIAPSGVFRFRSLLNSSTSVEVLNEELTAAGVENLKFRDVSRVNDDVFVTQTYTIARYRQKADGSIGLKIWDKRQVLPKDRKFRLVVEREGRPFVVLEDLKDWDEIDFATIDDNDGIQIHSSPRPLDDQQQLLGHSIGVVPLTHEQDSFVSYGAAAIHRIDGDRYRDITPAVLRNSLPYIRQVLELSNGWLAIQCDGHGILITDSIGTLRHQIPPQWIPSSQGRMQLDSIGRIWLPGESYVFRIDALPSKVYWELPDGHHPVSLAFKDRSLIVVSAEGVYAAEVTEGGEPELSDFRRLCDNPRPPARLKQIGGQVYLCSFTGLLEVDPDRPEEPLKKLPGDHVRDLVAGANDDQLLAIPFAGPVMDLQRTELGWRRNGSLQHGQEVRFPIWTTNGELWALAVNDTHDNALQKISLDEAQQTQTFDIAGLPFEFEGRLYSGWLSSMECYSGDGRQLPPFHRYEPVAEKFVPDEELNRLVASDTGRQQIGRLKAAVSGPNGELYLCTDRSALVRIYRQRGQLQLETVIGSATAGGGRAAAMGPDGRIWAVTEERIACGVPNESSSAPGPKRVLVTGVNLGNDPDHDRQQDLSIAGANLAAGPTAVDLDYTTTTLNLNFAIPFVLNPEGTAYQTRLTGLNETWSTSGPEGTRQFSALPPGDYVFEVRGILPSGQVTEATRLPIHVNPPWYQTTSFYVALGVMGLILGAAFVRWKTQMERHQIARLQVEVADRIKAEEQLKSSQQELVKRERLRALGELSAGVAHDLNNALTPMMAFSELLGDSPDLDSGTVRDYAGLLHQASGDAAAIVRRLQPLYRHDQTQDAVLQIQPILHDVVQLGEQYREAPKYEHKQIEFRFAGTEAAYYGDASILREILLNLLVNAMDAIQETGTVTLSSRSEDEHVVIEVRDDGIGMSEEVQHQCFDAFFTTKQNRGTGLGLWTSHSMIRGYGGELSVESEVGEGTVFRIRLPHRDSHSMIHTFPGSAEEEAMSLSILVVDDFDLTRAAICALLESQGHRVTQTGDPWSVLDLVSQQAFDIVVADHNMPECTGFELCERLRQSNPTLGTILATGHEEPGMKEVCDSFLVKPISGRAMKAALAQAVEQSRTRGGLVQSDAS